jgi:MFS-type transporter involved in bile tolerance (Atg22 family)
MIFRYRLKDPKAMIRIGMMFLAIALVGQRFFHPYFATKARDDFFDGLIGLLFGLSIGINLMAARLLARQRRSSGC